MKSLSCRPPSLTSNWPWTCACYWKRSKIWGCRKLSTHSIRMCKSLWRADRIPSSDVLLWYWQNCNTHKEIVDRFRPPDHVTTATTTLATFPPTVTSTPYVTSPLLIPTPSPTHGEFICIMDNLLQNGFELFFYVMHNPAPVKDDTEGMVVTHTHKHAHTCTYTNTQTHANTHTQTQTHTHTYAHTQTHVHTSHI